MSASQHETAGATRPFRMQRSTLPHLALEMLWPVL